MKINEVFSEIGVIIGKVISRKLLEQSKKLKWKRFVDVLRSIFRLNVFHYIGNRSLHFVDAKIYLGFLK